MELSPQLYVKRACVRQIEPKKTIRIFQILSTSPAGAAVSRDSQPDASGVAAILSLVLRGAGFPMANFDGASR